MAAVKDEAVDVYKAARQAYSLQSPRGLFRSRDLFRRSSELDGSFGKPRALLAYTLVQSWLQGWTGEEAMVEAGDLAKEAVRLAPDDPTTNAQLGFYWLNKRHFAAALDYYRRATALPGASDESKVDHAEAEIYAGNIQIGIDIIRDVMKSRPDVPDWHRWDLAWGLYLNGREDRGATKEALAELDRMQLKPEDPDYLVDCLLLRAVVEIKLDQAKQAGAHIELFLQRRNDWTLWREQRSVKFKRPVDEMYWLDGCKAARLPG
jgi:tetratricopeptide (TPR) repeat protein